MSMGDIGKSADGFEDWAVRWIIRALCFAVAYLAIVWLMDMMPPGLILPFLFLVVRARYRIVDDEEQIDWDKELRTLTKRSRL